MRRKTILITNDDGIFGLGLKPLIEKIKQVGKTIVVVPDKERSASSHSLTLKDPIRAREVSDSVYTLSGTPADCVRFGIIKLCKCKVDFVVSGINFGPNLGQDVIYSGTVAAVRESVLMNVPGFAVSLVSKTGKNFYTASLVAQKLAKSILSKKEMAFLNVNVPDLPASKIKGVSITCLGKKVYEDKIQSEYDPYGLSYYWLKSRLLPSRNAPGTDIHAVKNGMISITPLSIDSTDCSKMDELKKNWNYKIFRGLR
jgi:5'-nucleotidase